jgi:hypothetical protein
MDEDENRKGDVTVTFPRDEYEWCMETFRKVMELARLWDNLAYDDSRDRGQRVVNRLMAAELGIKYQPTATTSESRDVGRRPEGQV